MRRALILAALAVSAAAALAHGGGLDGRFVYDDHRFVEKNDEIASLSNLPRFFTDPATASASSGIEPDVYRPLRTLDFAIDRQAFGLAPLGWHAANLLLHVANAWLVLRLLASLLVPPAGAAPEPERRRGLVAAAFGALLFAAHPVAVECVAWVSSRGDLLSLFFLLAALEATSLPGTRRTLVGAAFLALACLAKESAVVGFLLLPLRDAALPAAARPRRGATLARTAAFLAVVGAYAALRVSVLPHLAQTDFPDGSRAAAARGMLAGVAGYARSLLWPVGFPFDRNVFTDPVPASFGDAQVLLGAGIVLGALAGGVVAWVRGRRVAAFAALGSLAALLPVSNVLVPLKAMTAERFLYPALPCLAAGAAAGALVLARRLAPRGRLLLAGVGAALAVVLALLSGARTAPWHDDLALWTAVRAADPLNPRAYEGLGFGDLEAGRLDAAERAFSTYREFQPFDGKVHVEMADTFRRVWHALRPASEGALVDTDILKRRQYIAAEEIRERRFADGAWARVGLARGRGSETMRRKNLESWREAALRFGDLAEARRVNERLVADDVAREGTISSDQRDARVLLAGMVLTPPPPPPPDPSDPTSTATIRMEWERRRREMAPTRAAILTDVGVDPSLADRDALVALLPGLAAAIADRPRDLARRHMRLQVLLAVTARLPDDGSKTPYQRIALEDLEVLAEANPSDGHVQQQVRDLRRILRPQ